MVDSKIKEDVKSAKAAALREVCVKSIIELAQTLSDETGERMSEVRIEWEPTENGNQFPSKIRVHTVLPGEGEDALGEARGRADGLPGLPDGEREDQADTNEEGRSGDEVHEVRPDLPLPLVG